MSRQELVQILLQHWFADPALEPDPDPGASLASRMAIASRRRYVETVRAAYEGLTDDQLASEVEKTLLSTRHGAAMSRIRASDPIEWLVERRFPNHKILLAGSVGSLTGGLSSAQRKLLSQEVDVYRGSLMAKATAEIRALTEQEEANEVEASRLQSERQERERFFNQPHARADFEHWSKAIYWSLDEALSLILGRAPEVVCWTNVQPHVNVSPFARHYARIRDLALRAKNWQQMFDPVMPGIFLAWARRTEIAVPKELLLAVESRGTVVADWKDLHDNLKKQFDAIVEEHSEAFAKLQQAIAERDSFAARVHELEVEDKTWQFDEDAENYPEELDIAMQGWRAASNQRQTSQSVKQQLSAWLRKTYPKLSAEARDRIATICNWEKRGGRRSLGS